MHRRSGFTLIELVMVILLVGILAAVAIPEFVDFRRDAKNASLKGGLGGVRAAIAVSRSAIALREDDTAPPYPTNAELNNNAYDGTHPVLSGGNIFDVSTKIPVNPWSDLSFFGGPSFANAAFDCTLTGPKGWTADPPFANIGWCYNEDTGEFWANSHANGASANGTENSY